MVDLDSQQPTTSLGEQVNQDKDAIAEKGSIENRRWLLYALGYVSIAVAAGAIYGWPVLRRQLIDEGSTLSETKLGLVYTIGAVSATAGRFFFGLIRDAMGTRFACIGCLLSTIIGAVLIAVADPSDGLTLAVATFMMGLGAGVQLCMQPVTQLFPEKSSMMMAGYSGAFNMSCLVFLILSLIAVRSQAMWGYAAVLSILAAMCMWLLPSTKTFEPPSKGSDDDDDDGGGGDNIVVKEEGTPPPPLLPPAAPVGRKEGRENGHSRWEQMRSTEYILMLLWLVVVWPPVQFYVASVGIVMEHRGDTTGIYNSIFVFFLAGVAIFAPVSGKIADQFGLGVAQAFATSLVALGFAIQVLPVSVPIQVQTVGFFSYGLGRLLIIAFFCSNVGRRFGFENYGILVGFGLLCGGLSSLLQYPLLEWGLSDAGGEGMWRVNATCVALLLGTLPYMLWLGLKERHESGSDSNQYVKGIATDDDVNDVEMVKVL
jgi:predicted MFS family arabinose efflux permease